MYSLETQNYIPRKTSTLILYSWEKLSANVPFVHFQQILYETWFYVWLNSFNYCQKKYVQLKRIIKSFLFHIDIILSIFSILCIREWFSACLNVASYHKLISQCKIYEDKMDFKCAQFLNLLNLSCWPEYPYFHKTYVVNKER